MQVAAEAERPTVGVTRVGTFEAFRYRDYRLLWSGNFLTTIANWIQITTMGWLAYALSGSGTTLGAVMAMRSIPTLIMAPLAGMAADRYSRNVIIAVSQLGLFGLTFLFALDIALGLVQVWHLFVFTLLIGAANSFNQPARQAYVFDLVPEHVVPNAVATNNIAMSTGRMLAAAGAGALIVAFGAATNFFVQSLMYLGIMGTVLAIRTSPGTGRAVNRQFFLRGIVEGYGYARRNPQARLLLLMMIINPLFFIPVHDALLPIFASSVLPGGAEALGLLLGALGAGGFAGGVLVATLSHVNRRGLLQLVALLIHGSTLATFCTVAFLTQRLWLALPILLASGVAESVHMTTNQTVLQLLAPDHLRGRITGVLQLSSLLNPIGVLTAGILADHLGPVGAGVGLSLCGFSLVVSIFVCSSRMRTLRLSELRELGRQGLRPAAMRTAEPPSPSAVIQS